jgi:hypothetical protein
MGVPCSFNEKRYKKTSAMGGFNRLQRLRIEIFLSKVSSTSKRGLEEEVLELQRVFSPYPQNQPSGFKQL